MTPEGVMYHMNKHGYEVPRRDAHMGCLQNPGSSSRMLRPLLLCTNVIKQ
jgi:hypothetical protein